MEVPREEKLRSNFGNNSNTRFSRNIFDPFSNDITVIPQGIEECRENSFNPFAPSSSSSHSIRGYTKGKERLKGKGKEIETKSEKLGGVEESVFTTLATKWGGLSATIDDIKLEVMETDSKRIEMPLNELLNHLQDTNITFELLIGELTSIKSGISTSRFTAGFSQVRGSDLFELESVDKPMKLVAKVENVGSSGTELPKISQFNVFMGIIKTKEIVKKNKKRIGGDSTLLLSKMIEIDDSNKRKQENGGMCLEETKGIEGIEGEGFISTKKNKKKRIVGGELKKILVFRNDNVGLILIVELVKNNFMAPDKWGRLSSPGWYVKKICFKLADIRKLAKICYIAMTPINVLLRHIPKKEENNKYNDNNPLSPPKKDGPHKNIQKKEPQSDSDDDIDMALL